MAEGNGNYDWRERMQRLEESVARNWEHHEIFERDLKSLHQSLVKQKEVADRLLDALRDLIDRIPPENLRQ